MQSLYPFPFQSFLRMLLSMRPPCQEVRRLPGRPPPQPRTAPTIPGTTWAVPMGIARGLLNPAESTGHCGLESSAHRLGHILLKHNFESATPNWNSAVEATGCPTGPPPFQFEELRHTWVIVSPCKPVQIGWKGHEARHMLQPCGFMSAISPSWASVSSS